MGKNAILEQMLAKRNGAPPQKPQPDALIKAVAKRAGAQPAVTTPTTATAPCYMTPLDRSRRRSFELRRRRASLTPEDAERLLRNRDKVLGAALSMHVIHDVPLDVVGERLAASGVRPELRDEALAAIRAKLKRSGIGERAFDDEQERAARKLLGANSPLPRYDVRRGVTPRQYRSRVAFETPAAPEPEPEPEADDPLTKYRKMIKMGVPPSAAAAAARRDGVADALAGTLDPAAAAPSAATAATADAAVLEPYRKMLRMRVPPCAVGDRMRREKRSEADVAAVLGAKAEPRKPATKLPARTPAPRKTKQLHWTKLDASVDVGATVWGAAASPTPEADDDLALLEEIFASKPPRAKTVRKANDKTATDPAEAASLKKVSLLEDSRRAANVAIGLEYFSRQYRGDDDALCRAVASLSEWLDGPKLRSLQVQLPKPEEESLVKSYVEDKKNDAARLARPERFFAAALRWPRFAARVESACFRAEFDEQAWDACRAADKVTGAVAALVGSEGLSRVLRYLLKAGNKLNSGLASGGAAGVALGSLGAFATARGKGGANLVDYVADIFAERGQAADLDFVDTLPALAEAARYVDDDHTRGALRKLRDGLAKVEAEAATARAALSAADRKRAAALRKSGEAPAPEVQSPAAPAVKGRAALDAQASVRFVVEAGRCVDEAAKAVAGLEAKIADLEAATKKCRAYFGATSGPAAAALKLVFGALDGFASEVRRSRDKLRRKLAAKERNARRGSAAAKTDPAAAAATTTGRTFTKGTSARAPAAAPAAPAARIRGARKDAAGPVLARCARPARDAPAAAAPKPVPPRPRVALSASAQSAVDRAFALTGGRRANTTDSQVLAKSKALASHKALADKQKRLAAAQEQADAPPVPPGVENVKPRRFF